MRVLFAVNPEKTIFYTMVPLAWALRTAGHDVRVASQPRFATTITQAGLTAVPVGRDRDRWQVAGQKEELRAGLPAPYDAAVAEPASLDAETLVDGYERQAVRWHKLDNFPIIADLVDYARHWQPDLVIWEPLTNAGAIAAKACGAAHARLLWSVDVFGVTRARLLALRPPKDPLRDWLGGYAEFTEDMVTGQFSIDLLPDSLAMPTDLHRVPMGYLPYGGPAVVPRWLWEPPHRPRVALTLGTTSTEQFAGYATDVPELLDALSTMDVEVIATVAPQTLDTVPENVRAVGFVPLDALVSTCAAVVNHAGPGTLLTTARHAVPQLAVPWDFDEPELARRAGVQGAALVIRADTATGPAVRDGVHRLLHEPEFAGRAARLRDEILAMPTPNQIVPQLEELTAKYR
jgi:glycosyltransferase (activator-dependent family)